MNDEKIPSPTAAPADASATGATPSQPDLGPAIANAGAAALQQHVAENAAKRGRGRPRKTLLPVGAVGDGAGAPLSPGDPANVLPVDFQAPQPAVDEATVQALAEGFAGLLEDLGKGWLRSQVLRHTKDVKLAEEAAKGGEMSEGTRKMIVLGSVQCAKKYLSNIEYAPEVALVGGLGLYSFGVWSQGRTFNAKIQELRAAQPA
jgi:hypothetical protein